MPRKALSMLAPLPLRMAREPFLRAFSLSLSVGSDRFLKPRSDQSSEFIYLIVSVEVTGAGH